MNPRKSIFPFLIWCALLILLAGIDLLQGIFPISSEADLVILRMVRLPRILTAIIAGGGLAVAGAQMQSILINPLADPHIMGISSGASLGAAIATLAGGYIGLSGGMSVAIACCQYPCDRVSISITTSTQSGLRPYARSSHAPAKHLVTQCAIRCH